MENKAMTLLLIEDSKRERKAFTDCVSNRSDVEFIGVTDSDIEALKIVKQKHPEGIILDLELNNGSGNGTGLDFLIALKELNLVNMPKVIVTTHIHSDATYNFLHKNGVDLILYKEQANYSCNYVINTLLLLRDCNSKNSESLSSEPEIDENKISKCIYHELDLIGIGPTLKGRKYIHDAICYLIQNSEKPSNVSVIQYLVNIYKKSSSTITRGIQNAIIHAWRISSLEDLSSLYTAKINYETGIPTPMEFIYYYVDKIKKIL